MYVCPCECLLSLHVLESDFLCNSITRALSGLLFGNDELIEMRRYMKLAVVAATHSKFHEQVLEPVHYTII